MLPTRRIQKNYEIFFSLLKFVLENNEQPKYKDLDLVETFSRLLKEIKEELEDFFGEPVNKEHEIDFKVLVSPFLKEGFEDIDKKIQKINNLINADEKIELIKQFLFVMHLTDCASDREPEEEEDGPTERFKKINQELTKILDCFKPILPLIEDL